MSQRRAGAVLSYGNVFAKNLVILFYTPILLKYLGKSEYGLYQMANSVISSLSILSMGFSSSYIRFFTRFSVKKKDDMIKKLNGTYLILFLIISIVSLIIGAILVFNTNIIFSSSLNEDEILLTKRLMSLMVLNIALTFPSSVFDSNIIANEKFIFQQSRQLFQNILLPVFTIPLLSILNMDSISIVLVQTVLSLVLLVLNARYAILNLKMKFDFKNYDFSLIKELIEFSFFIFLNQIINQVNNNVPNFIIGIFSGAYQVSIYSIANQLKNLFFMLSQALSSVFIPKVNQIVSKNDDNEELTNLMTRIGRAQIIVLSFILGGFIVLGKFFILKWAGTGFDTSYYLLISMVMPVLIPLSQNIGIEIQQAKNKHIFRSIVLSLFALLNIILTVIFVKRWGAAGATIGYIVSLVFGNGIVMNWYYHNKIGLDMKKYWFSVIPLLIPVIAATVFSSLISSTFISVDSFINFIIVGFLYCSVYILVLYIFLSDTEKKIITSFRKKGN